MNVYSRGFRLCQYNQNIKCWLCYRQYMLHELVTDPLCNLALLNLSLSIKIYKSSVFPIGGTNKVKLLISCFRSFTTLTALWHRINLIYFNSETEINVVEYLNRPCLSPLSLNFSHLYNSTRTPWRKDNSEHTIGPLSLTTRNSGRQILTDGVEEAVLPRQVGFL